MNRKIFLVTGIISFIIFVIGFAYAFFEWNSSLDEQTDLNIIVSGTNIIYNGGNHILDATLNPTSTKEEGIIKELTIVLEKTQNIETCVDFNLILTKLPTELQHISFKYEMYKEDELVQEGNFSDKTEGSTIKLATTQRVTEDISNYKLYLWIDGNIDNPTGMQGKSFTFTINAITSEEGECGPSVIAADTSGASTPELFEGMIPVKWDENNAVVKADVNNLIDNSWYNYTEKQWANAVMVRSATRENYMNASVGTAITTSDILAYWVWIPRYNYKLFNPTFASGTSPVTIEVEFVDTDTIERTVKTKGAMYTHPAFTFGNTELSGFWIGKFEPSGRDSSGSLKIVPGASSLRDMTISDQFSASQLFMNTSYLTSNGVNTVDSHMIKNIEWGAVAFLSHSIYGKNSEITINSSGSYYTGGSSSATSYITNIAQSTTGNVYGAYDMNGGAWEYVMGSYNKTIANSGFSRTDLLNMNAKYINVYEGSTAQYSILGDALGETQGWYSDSASFVTSDEPWYMRSGRDSNGENAGAFHFTNTGGTAGSGRTFRPVLTAK